MDSHARDVQLIVGGKAYIGWTGVSITRRVEAIAGDFRLDIAGPRLPWRISDESVCTLKIGDETVISGFVDESRRVFDGGGCMLSASGRDRAAALVDSSVLLKKWEFKGVSAFDICTAVADPFGIRVGLQKGLVQEAILGGGGPAYRPAPDAPAAPSVTEPFEKISLNPGETAFEVIDRVCRVVGVLPISDGLGGLVLSRAGAEQTTTALVEGENLLSADFVSDASGRFRRYVVRGQSRGSDTRYGASAAAVSGEASDMGVVREERVLLIRPHGSVTTREARQIAEWECAIRKARARRAAVVVQGWHQRNGKLWPINAVVGISSPSLGLDGTMLISEVSFELSAEVGTITRLSLVQPDSYVPQPRLAAADDGLV